MTFDATHSLRFINRARAAMGLAALDELPFPGALVADERNCVLARALLGEVGGSDHPAWDGRFVVRLGDESLAELVAAATGQPHNDRGEVLLPEPLENLAVGFDHGWITRSGARYLPSGQLSFEDLDLRAISGRRRRERGPMAGSAQAA